MKRSFLVCFCLAVFAFIITWLFAGFYYESNDDFAMDYTLRGQMGSVIDNFYICLSGITEFFAALYKVVPGFPFYSASLYFLLLVSTATIFSLLNKFSGGLDVWKKLGLLGLFYYLFLLENVMYFNFTRVALLLCASALLKIYDLSLSKAGFLKTSLFILLLLIGALIRIDSFYLSCLIVLPGILLMEYCRTGKAQKLVLNLLGIVLLTGFSAYLIIWSLDNPSVRASIKLTTFVSDYHVIDKAKVVNPADRLYYEGIYHWFFGDGAVYSFNKLSSFIDRNSYTLFYFNRDKIFFSSRIFLEMLIRNYFSFVICNALFLFFCLNSSLRGKKFLLLFTIYVWSGLFLVAVLFKVEERVLCPALVIYTMINMLIVLKHITYIPFRKFVLGLTALLFVLNSVKLVQRVRFASQRQAENTEALVQIKHMADENPYVLATVAGRYVTFLDPFKTYDTGLGHKLIRLSGWFAVFPQNHAMISKAAGKDSLPDLFDYCARNRIPFLASQSEIRFLQEYFRVFYKQEFRFEKKERTKGMVEVYYVSDKTSLRGK